MKVWPGENAQIEYWVSKAFGRSFQVQVRSSSDEGPAGATENFTLRAEVQGLAGAWRDARCVEQLKRLVVDAGEVDAVDVESEEVNGFTFVNVYLEVRSAEAVV